MPVILRAIKPNAGIRVAYRKRLEKEIEAMNRSISWWVTATYRKRESRIMGQDAAPITSILKRFDEYAKKWEKKWDIVARWLGGWFVRSIQKRTFHASEEAFRAAGFTVKLTPSRKMKDKVAALTAANVNLIKSIPRQYLSDVRDIVTRSVIDSRDLGYMAGQIQARYKKTRQRAALIARDQANKATQAIKMVRSEELGITEGIWVHLPGKYSSRKTHKAMNGKRFILEKGLYDSQKGVQRYVKPGELPFCQCTYREIIPEVEALQRRKVA